MRSIRVLIAAMSGLTLAVLLTACAPGLPSNPNEPVPEPATSDTAEGEAPAAPAGDGSTPEWAKPVTTPGEKITTITGEGFQIDVYQVGTAKATKTGQFVTPEGEPVISVGDEIVFVNYVLTNTGSADIPLSSLLIDVSARYASWPYLQGMDSVVDSALFEQMDVNSDPFAIGIGASPYVWAPGTSYSWGENFLYEKGGAITFTTTFTPALDDGSLDHDKRVEIKTESAIV